mmetsp:Transcript_11287/g.33451  ORF Transcript_11287/g.33451 Transcript_11287/m.33451 type:complete len:247 (-) Transcript_11287:63-803(-)
MGTGRYLPINRPGGLRTRLTNENLALFRKAVRRHLEVVRGRTLADTPRNVVVRAVARAEPALVVAGVRDGHAAEVGAHSEDDEPLCIAADAVSVGLGIAQVGHVAVVGACDLLLRASANEDGLAAPLDGHALPGLDVGHVHLHACEGEHICRGVHLCQELDEEEAGSGSSHEARAAHEHVVVGAHVGLPVPDVLLMLLPRHAVSVLLVGQGQAVLRGLGRGGDGCGLGPCEQPPQGSHQGPRRPRG